jgi:hypothetical protein
MKNSPTLQSNERPGFIEWMLKIQNVHYANKPAMERAFKRLVP